MSDPLDQIDSLLGDILAEGWNDDPQPLVKTPEYPPLPERKQALVVEKPTRNSRVYKAKAEKLATAMTEVVRVDKEQAKALARQAMDEAGITYGDDTLPPENDENAPRGLFDIGLLSDLATGRKSAVEAAEAAGVTPERMQSQLATALREVDPREIAKALGLQAAEQQLKSGAMYGVVLSTLVDDVMAGRLSPMAKIELAKLLANVGKIMPKEDKSVGQGSGFVLNISMGAAPAQPITIDAD